jgi:hypothetical protein
MNAIDALVCPACERLVEPCRRKLPSEQVTTGEGSTKYSAPMLAFGFFCPHDDCKARLDRAIEKAQVDAVEVEQPIQSEVIAAEPSDEQPNIVSIPERRTTPAPVRNVKPASDEDLFSRIRREHAEALREEQELIARLAQIADRRKKLDLLITAMNVAQEQIAAE